LLTQAVRIVQAASGRYAPPVPVVSFRVTAAELRELRARRAASSSKHLATWVRRELGLPSHLTGDDPDEPWAQLDTPEQMVAAVTALRDETAQIRRLLLQLCSSDQKAAALGTPARAPRARPRQPSAVPDIRPLNAPPPAAPLPAGFTRTAQAG
jgi:hypothetical protein